MARSLRDSRFRGRDALGEDVNPSSYIVNLADCMLVLACGCMVAVVTAWGVDLSVFTELDDVQLSEVEAEEAPEGLTEGGSYYEDVGTAYRDPNTGQVYIVEEVSTADEDEEAAEEESADEDEADSDGAAEAGSTATATDASRSARAMGAD